MGYICTHIYIYTYIYIYIYIPKNAKAPQAAAVIHSAFEKHFIRVETIKYEDVIKYGGDEEAKRNGAMRVEGKDYIMQDGDVVHFLTSA